MKSLAHTHSGDKPRIATETQGLPAESGSTFSLAARQTRDSALELLAREDQAGELDQVHWVVALRPLRALEPAEIQTLIGQLAESSSSVAAKAVVLSLEGYALVLCVVPASTPDTWTQAWLDGVFMSYVDAGWWVGVSRPQRDAALLAGAQIEATDALEACRQLGRRAVGYRSELPLYRLLSSLRANDEHLVLLRETLAPLSAYDLEHGTELTPTLAEFLAQNANAVQTARVLKVHRNTLNYRLQRIAEITGLDLSRANERLMLHLALSLES